MKKMLEFVIFLWFLAIVVGQASGQDLIVYPAKGRSQQQMEKDKFDCYSWAKNRAGLTPCKPRRHPRRHRVLRPGASSGAALAARPLAQPSVE